MNKSMAELSVALTNALRCFRSHVTEQVLSAVSRKHDSKSTAIFFGQSDSGLSLYSFTILASTRHLTVP